MITPEQNVRITVRPIASALPLGSSKESIEGNLEDQLRGVGHEAGVRQVL